MKRGITIALQPLVLAVALYGCTSVQPVAPQVRVESKHVFEKNYSLGVEASAYVGEPIVKVKDYYETSRESDALAASESFKLNMALVHTVVPSGTVAMVSGTTQKHGKTYRLASIQVPDLRGLLFYLNEDGSFEGTAKGQAFSCHTEPKSARFIATTVTKADTSKGFKNFELVFGGVTKDSITVLYREYTPDDLARAAYSQNLVYPKESTSIRYRDIAITIIEASNERLRYVVKADGLK